MEMVLVILSIMLSPAIIMVVIGKSVNERKPKTAKILYILAAIYTIIGLGICGTMLTGL